MSNDQRLQQARNTAHGSDDELLLCSALTDPSKLTHRVVVYSSDEAVPSQRFVAYITVPTRQQKTGILSERRLGISFAAPEHEEARRAAETYWQAELERERNKIEASAKRGEAHARRRAPTPSSQQGG